MRIIRVSEESRKLAGKLLLGSDTIFASRNKAQIPMTVAASFSTAGSNKLIQVSEASLQRAKRLLQREETISGALASDKSKAPIVGRLIVV
jgi:hypothetical protein